MLDYIRVYHAVCKMYIAKIHGINENAQWNSDTNNKSNDLMTNK